MIIPLIILMMLWGSAVFGYVGYDAHKVDEKGIFYAMMVAIVIVNVLGLEMLILEIF